MKTKCSGRETRASGYIIEKLLRTNLAPKLSGSKNSQGVCVALTVTLTLGLGAN